MERETKEKVYTGVVMIVFTCMPMIIFDGNFEDVMVYTFPFIFLGVGFSIGSVWIFEKFYNYFKSKK